MTEKSIWIAWICIALFAFFMAVLAFIVGLFMLLDNQNPVGVIFIWAFGLFFMLVAIGFIMPEDDDPDYIDPVMGGT